MFQVDVDRIFLNKYATNCECVCVCVCKQRPVLWSEREKEFIREMELFLLPFLCLLLVAFELDYSGIIPFIFRLIRTVLSQCECF